MRLSANTLVLLGVLLCGGVAVGAATPLGPRAAARATGSAASSCDRDCLDGFIDQYLSALAAHDPSRLPLAKNLKFTEDGVQLTPGDGLWATATGIGSYKLYFAEPEAGSVGAFVLIQENGTPAILLVRLKVVKRQITEIETLVARKQTTSLLNTDNLTTPPPIFLEAVAAADRPSRAEMTAIVNKYFEGIEQGNGDIVPFDKDCVRIENGVQTCPSSASSRLGALSCGAQLSTKIFTYIQSVSPRRFAVVDRERGLVLAIVRFNHPASQQTVEVPGRGTMKMGPFSEWPNSTQIAELFKVQNGKIREITAVIVTGAYKASMGWE
ncbi:MAG TPA: hypothetical protein VMB02_13375 [Candidatus Aquilonibacter sp.]|nr:hypothetical protein [Candidatus Aquilonibacter sp.]